MFRMLGFRASGFSDLGWGSVGRALGLQELSEVASSGG